MSPRDSLDKAWKALDRATREVYGISADGMLCILIVCALIVSAARIIGW